ncbi:transposase [Moraxella sp. ZY210820]|uniref:transposase n=1 Tax=unclassified Moraxella TaxID=2685852 RepID=UPI0027317066|nr:transposase [Moraxella sp. ZY210820]WLF83632.1 transposase [Moraxella sp. ZY210820]
MLFVIKNTSQNNRLELYQSRWQIECLFKALKSSGFHLKDAHVKDLQRLHILISVCLFAFVWCYRIGEYIHEHIQPIVIKTHGLQAESVFKYGLDKLSRYLISGFKPKEIINMDFFRWFLSCT